MSCATSSTAFGGGGGLRALARKTEGALSAHADHPLHFPKPEPRHLTLTRENAPPRLHTTQHPEISLNSQSPPLRVMENGPTTRLMTTRAKTLRLKQAIKRLAPARRD